MRRKMLRKMPQGPQISKDFENSQFPSYRKGLYCIFGNLRDTVGIFKRSVFSYQNPELRFPVLLKIAYGRIGDIHFNNG